MTKQGALFCAILVVSPTLSAERLTPIQRLGQRLFNDTTLSEPAGQSCASCHDPAAAFTDPDRDLPVSEGAVAGRLGTRNTPSAAYTSFSPHFHFDPEEGLYVGGQFLDGRAPTLRDQATQPFFNPDEMNNPDAAALVDRIKTGNYQALFQQVFGREIFQQSLDDIVDKVGEALAAFENAGQFNRFTSKYDYSLAGIVRLSRKERRGLALFEGKAGCNLCHISRPDEDGNPPLFTDFTYDNLGVPANPQLLALKGADFVDEGLSGNPVVQRDGWPLEEKGKFKVPSLRNVALTAPYFHNGVFDTLEQVVDFYNTRDVDPTWPAPEVAENVNTDELGNLGLSNREVGDLLAFMGTLTDGYRLSRRQTLKKDRICRKKPETYPFCNG